MTRSDALRRYADALGKAYSAFILEHIEACAAEVAERIDLSFPVEMLIAAVRAREFAARDDEAERSKVVPFPARRRTA